MKQKKLYLPVTLSIITSLILACGGGASEVGWNGKLVDSNVEGATWSCGSASGLTDSNGTFGTCQTGSSVTFKVGNIILGTVAENSDHIFTMYDLISVSRDKDNNTQIENDKATKIALLLLSLDNDANPSNGIKLLPAVIKELIRNTTVIIGSGNEINIRDISQANIESIVSTTAANINTENINLQAVTISIAFAHINTTSEQILNRIITSPTQSTLTQTGGALGS